MKDYRSDCFAYIKRGKCRVLTEWNCPDCPFYKTKSQYDDELYKSGQTLLKRIEKMEILFQAEVELIDEEMKKQ